MRARRTLVGVSDTDARMIEEFLGGTEVPEIAARYGVHEAYVDRVIEQTSRAEPKRWSWSIQNWGNRVLYSLLAGFAINLLTGLYAAGAAVAVVLFVLMTTIVVAGRRD